MDRKTFFELTKFRIAVVSTMSAAAGFLSFKTRVDIEFFAGMFGVLLLACGALALNQYQERDVDGLMERTMHRPLPTGKVRPEQALFISVALILIGSNIILATGGLISMALGYLNVVWYNAIYTPLKRVSAFAVLPGSMVGAIPPAIGWSIAGGSLQDPAIMAIAFFFFIWQVPHFWLLLFRFGYQYEQAKLMSLTTVFSARQLTRITFVWIVATAFSSYFLHMFGAVTSNVSIAGLVIGSVWLVFNSAQMLRSGSSDRSFRMAFRSINMFALLVMVLVSIDRVLAGG